jgi:hypothetical protein
MNTSREIKVAVSGHRQLTNLPYLENDILAAADRIQTAFSNHQYHVWSCLAEGADRILSRILVKRLEAKLTIVLPLPELEYIKDFKTDKSIQEFRDLKQMADNIIVPDQIFARPLAYQVANHTLLQDCDLLVTIWDGMPARGPGGTSEVVESIRQAEKPLLWIHTVQEKNINVLTEERFPNLNA